jgi:hypothetical protein
MYALRCFSKIAYEFAIHNSFLQVWLQDSLREYCSAV